MNQALPKRARLPLWRSFAVYAIIVAWYEGINVYTHHDPWYVAVSHMPWYVAMEHAPWYVATELMPVLLPAVGGLNRSKQFRPTDSQPPEAAAP